LAFLVRHPLAILADVVAMSAPGEPLIGSDASAEATIMTHSNTPPQGNSRETHDLAIAVAGDGADGAGSVVAGGNDLNHGHVGLVW
jgi:hypothetical protein